MLSDRSSKSQQTIPFLARTEGFDSDIHIHKFPKHILISTTHSDNARSRCLQLDDLVATQIWPLQFQVCTLAAQRPSFQARNHPAVLGDTVHLILD